MKSSPFTVVAIALLVVGAVALGATMFEPKHDGPFERLGEKIDKATR